LYVLLSVILISCLGLSAVRGLSNNSKTIDLFGQIIQHPPDREILVEWSISEGEPWGVTEPDYGVNISKKVGATTVLLVVYLEQSKDISAVQYYVEKYRSSGFSVWISLGIYNLLKPSDISHLFSLNITGVALDLLQEFDQSEAESSLIDLAKALRVAGIKLAYYQGDGLSNVNATRLSDEGIIVWAWGGPNWKPGPEAWNLSPIWAQLPIFNTENKCTTSAEINTWYQSLPRKPEGIVWWLTTCFHKPTEEQIGAMTDVCATFLKVDLGNA
jgi:hypothetical protein